MTKKILNKVLLFVLFSAIGLGATAMLSSCKIEFDQELNYSHYLDDSNAYFENDEIDIEFVTGVYVTYSKPNSKGEIVIPSYVGGQPVVGINGDFSIDCRLTLKKITIPKSVKVIRGGLLGAAVN